MKKVNFEERKICATIDAFIIPNPATKFGDYFIKNKRAVFENLLQLNGMNNINLDDQNMVQMWYTAEEELGSDNLIAHGFTVKTEDRIYCFNMFDLYALPYCFLDGKKEGDVIKVTFPIKCSKYNLDYELVSDEDRETNWLFEAEIKLNQQGYRYSNFGTFENALSCVIF